MLKNRENFSSIFDGINVDFIDKKWPNLYNGLNGCHGHWCHIHSFTSNLSTFEMIIRNVTYTPVCQFRAKSDKNWQFWKNDLDIKHFNFQRLERSLNQGQIRPAYVIVSRIRNILVSVRNLYLDWLKHYDQLCVS